MGILALNLEKIGTTAHPPLYNMWASLITLTFVAILGHSSAFGIHQPLPWTTYDTSLLHSQKQCVQQVIDADSLLKIITKIVDDIPNICLSKFKMCGGFETPSPYPPPPLDFPEFRSTEDRSPQSNDIPSEEEVVEEVFEDGNGTETSSGKTRQRRSTSGYGGHGYGHAGYGGYGHGGYRKFGYGGLGYGGYGGLGYGGYGGYGYKHYAPSFDYYAPEHYHRVSLWNLAYKNHAFKNAYLGNLYHKKHHDEVPDVVN